MKKDSNSQKKKSPLSILWTVLSWLLVLVVVLLAVALVGVRVLGYTPYAILSPSMTPAYQVGDLVYVKECAADAIRIGDPLTFVANDQLLVVTHRVVDVDYENDVYLTKGDANEENDSNPVHYENVLGTVRFSLPKLGYVSTYFTSASGRYVGMTVILVLILLFVLPDLFRKKKPDADVVE